MEVVMRGIDTPVRKMRREIFKEIAQLAYHSDNLNDDVEALPYKIVNPETPIYRESIYREREIVREQIRLPAQALVVPLALSQKAQTPPPA